MVASSTHKEWNPYFLLNLILLLLLTPSFSFGWTTKKCIYTGKLMSVQDSVFGKSCTLYKNATSLALCKNITNLETDLSDVPANTEILCLSGTNKVIHGGSFAKFRQMIYLSIRMPINEILPEAFKGLENLQSLSISFLGHYKCNNISMPENALTNLSSLKDLGLERYHLTKNTLIKLPPYTKLYALKLSQNCVTNLFQVLNIFQDLVSINTLNVINNKIRRIDSTLVQDEPVENLPNIKELNLSNNPIRSIKNNAFAKFNLHLLNLDYTSLHLTDLLTSGIVKLESLSLRSACKYDKCKIQLMCSIVARFQLKILKIQVNGITAVPPGQLSKCHSLETFDLSHNHLKMVDSNILYVLPKLRALYLSHNYLNIDLCPEWYNNRNFSSGLQLFQFSHNVVTVLRNRQFVCIPSLQELVLNNNNIASIEHYAFWGLKSLQILVLSNNKLIELPSGSLSGLFNLKEVSLKNNKLPILGYQDFQDQTQLNLLKFGSVSVKFTEFDLIPNLHNLEIQNSGKYVHINAQSNITSSLHSLFFNGSRLKINAACNHTFYTNLRELKVYNNYEFESCNESGSAIQHFKNLEKLQYHFNGKPFAEKLNFSNMPNLIHLEVQNLATTLDISKVNPLDLFRRLYKLEIFKLINSGIQYFPADLFKDMKSLRLLLIENGLILAIDPGIQGALTHASYMYFNDMTFQCDCANAWFVNWAIKQKQTFVSSVDTAMCLQLNKRFNLLTFVGKNCDENTEFILFLVTFTSLSTFIILMLIYNIFNSSILQLIFIFRVWLHKLRGKKCDLIKYDYDAFVSYCSLDQVWIIKYLIPNLEEKGPPFLKLCLHNRDFQVGKDIVDNIMDSINKSRKTICLISQSYLKSEWCSLEMRMATYRTLAEKNDDLILLFLERISRYQLSSYHRLAKIVMKKTYIDWPEEENEQNAFWERLRLTIMDEKEMQCKEML